MAARIPNIEPLIAMGIDPNTGLPYRLGRTDITLKENIRKALRVADEQDAIRRYKWYNLPDSITGDLVERMLYYKGQVAMFYMKELDKFYILPYALCSPEGESGIDVYGRYTGITPLPFNGTSQLDGGKQKPWITGLIKYPKYNILTDDDIMEEGESVFTDSCVLLSDYSKQISQTVIPRKDLQEPILDVMSNMIPFLNTSLQNQTGTAGVRVNNEDEQSNVTAANATIKRAALTGEKFVAITGAMEFQELTAVNPSNAADFMQAMESLDNFRLGLYGIENGGIFQKKAHMLQDEQNMAAGGGVGLVYQDGLTLRQDFCDIVNSIWGLGIWCEPSETEIGDANMDGFGYDDEDQSGMNEGNQDSMEANNGE